MGAVEPAQGGGRKAYLSALTVAQIAALGRSVVLARMLGPEQMGLAAIIVVTAQFFDSITDTGTDRFLIQDRYGDTPEAVQLVHLVALLKGALIALLLIIFAESIARFTGAPAAAGALAALAIVPFLNGFVNYQYRIAQRHHQFGPEAKIMFFGECSGLVGTAVAAFVVHNFTAVLYGLAVRALARVIVSQSLGSVYRPRYASEPWQRLWKFSAPLLANGFLIFLATQSDRILISRYLGLADLGRYTVVLLLGWYPSSTIALFLGSVYLPLIAGARDDPRGMRFTANQLESAAMLLAVMLAVGFAFVVPTLLPLLFGSKFAAGPEVITLLGLVTSWRMMKCAPTTVAIAIGRTNIMLVNNLLRLSGIACAVAGVYLVGGIVGIAGGLIAGEIIANVAASLMVSRATRWSFTSSALRYGFAGAVGSLLLLRSYGWKHGSMALSVTASLGCFGLLVICGWTERHTILEIANLLRRKLKF
jgi:O-antigen/teichoic acid export membrane protein